MQTNTPILRANLGIPGSGKSTYAATTGMVVVNRDQTRFSLYGKWFTGIPSHEDEVTKVNQQLIVDAITAGKSVIEDDTHMSIKSLESLERLARRLGLAQVEWVDFTDVPLTVCKERNAKRDRVVPDHVLDSMHSRIPQIVSYLSKNPFFKKVSA